jgi:hypothetical protein
MKHETKKKSFATTCFDMVYDKGNECLNLNLPSFSYEIDLDRIKNERDLLAWACHLCQKSWMTTSTVRSVVVKISEIKGFNPYGL